MTEVCGFGRIMDSLCEGQRRIGEQFASPYR
jgi:hypothetical protein